MGPSRCRSPAEDAYEYEEEEDSWGGIPKSRKLDEVAKTSMRRYRSPTEMDEANREKRHTHRRNRMNAHSLGAVAQYVQAMDDVTDADLEAFLDIAYLVAPLAIGNLFIPPNHPQSFTALDLFGATINAYNHGHGRLGASGMNHVHWNNAYMPL